MPETTSLELRLDLADERLWRGCQAIRLKPKVFTLLRYFAEHPKRLLTKDDILAAIWPDTCVSEELIKDYVQQLRRALVDDIKRPRFIETVWGRGYRYIGEISLDERSSPAPALGAPPPTPEPLGRDTDLAELRRWWGEALSGARRLAFISGEPGIGKTTLVNAFLAERASEGWIAQGKGVEFYGAGEGFLPILEALEQLCRRVDGKPVIACLKEHAPTWLLQLPVAIDDRAELQRRAQGASRERMLRELAQALEALAAERGLILCLEDLHWTDDSTLEVLVYLAQRRQPARLLLIGTYRPVDMYEATNALARLLPELRAHGRCEELPLALLNEAVITQYLARHFPSLPAEFARPLRRQSGGNPLFLVNVLEHLRAQGMIAQAEGRWTLQGDPQAIGFDIPPTLQQLLEQRLERFSMADQRLLETASAAGFAFTAEVLAAVLAEEPETVEERCAQLSRRAQWLRASGEERWPQGTVTARYEFLHALYQQVLYRRLTPVRRARIHQCIGERLELGYGEQTPVIAAELAGHFERAGDQVQSVRYLGQVA